MRAIVAILYLATACVFSGWFGWACALKAPPQEDPTQQLSADLALAEHQRNKAYDLIELTYGVKVGVLTYLHTPVTVSAYTARAEECNSSPHVTADMTPSRVGLLAVSRDMLTEIGLRMGDMVLLIDGDHNLGVFQVRDKMAKRWRRRVDILHGNVKAAKAFGVRSGVTLVKVVSNG